MERINIFPRANWQAIAKAEGYDFHQTIHETPCWDESVVYVFTLEEVEEIEAASEDLHLKCLDLVREVSQSSALMSKMQIPEFMHDVIRDSIVGMTNETLSGFIYGRFDFAYTGFAPPKLLEYNADTPTALYETAVWQWKWLEDLKATHGLTETDDQFNSVHEKLIARWKMVPDGETIYFTSLDDEEDRGTVRYLEDTASQAGYPTQYIAISDIGSDHAGQLCDLEGYHIHYIFKLYPWEWLTKDNFALNVKTSATQFIEPPWKMILSNKAILPLLWERYPDHPNLLPAYFEDDTGHFKDGNFVKKPFFSREGSNVTIVRDKNVVASVGGVYGQEGYIKQGIANIPVFYEKDATNRYAVIGSWVIGNDPAGMIIRESTEVVTNNWSKLVPHIIRG